MKKKYSVHGSITGIGKKDLPVVIRELNRIEKEIGIITPGVIVRKAEGKRSPLHRFFEWDDSAAAKKYREWQARTMIRCVQVTICDEAGDDITVRAFVNVCPNEEDDDPAFDRGYISVHRAIKNGGYKGQVIQYAYNQLVNWRKRFGAFKQFCEVVSEIDRIKINS